MKKTITFLILLAWFAVGVSAAQAQSKLSALPSITCPADTDLLYVVKPGDPSPDRKLTIADLKTLIEGVIAASPRPGSTAADITFAPAGNIAAVNVQAAIQELDTEKLSTSGTAALATALAANGTNCGAGEASAGVDASGNAEGCFTPAGAGSAPALDLGNDAVNESAGLALVATTGDTNSIFSEPSADKLLIDVSKKWPVANTADALTRTRQIAAPRESAHRINLLYHPRSSGRCAARRHRLSLRRHLPTARWGMTHTLNRYSAPQKIKPDDAATFSSAVSLVLFAIA